jgi:adenylate kinase
MNKFVITGIQGCGKGTQAQMLTTEFGLVHINVGEIIRWNIENHTKVAARINRLVASGQMVPDEIIEEIVGHRLDEHDWNFGFVLDGFPRNHAQTMFFLESYDADAVIHIRIPDDVVLKRVLSRRLCNRCNLDYNLIYHRPAVADTCDICGGELEKRPDDNKASISERIKDYHNKTEPVLDLFRQKELVIEIDGDDTPENVQRAIRGQLGFS